MKMVKGAVQSLVLLVGLFGASTAAFAVGNVTDTGRGSTNVASGAVSGSQSQSDAGALSVSGGIGNDNSTHVAATDLSRAVGAAVAPALTTTLTETCMGSTSMGAGFSGASMSFGTTWRDHACVRRLDAREIKTFGDAQAAKEIMCDSDLVREAFKRVGRPCAVDGGTYVAVSQVQPTPAVIAPAIPAPVDATDSKVRDDQDLADQSWMSEAAKLHEAEMQAAAQGN